MQAETSPILNLVGVHRAGMMTEFDGALTAVALQVELVIASGLCAGHIGDVETAATL
jgi:hypothetical protein